MMELTSTTEQCICLESWPHKLICNSQLKHVCACSHHVMEVYVSNVPWKNFHQLHISLLWKRAWFWLAQLSWFFLRCKHASVTTWKYPITRDTISGHHTVGILAVITRKYLLRKRFSARTRSDRGAVYRNPSHALEARANTSRGT